MKKNLSDFDNIKILIKTISSINKFYVPLFILGVFIKSLSNILNIYIPMIFISSVEKSWSINKTFKMIIALICVKIFLKILEIIFERWQKVQKELLNIKFPQLLAEKIMKMPYENLENPEILDLKERALFPITSYGAIYNFINNSSTVLKGLITIIASFSIIIVFSKALVSISIILSFLTIIIDKKMNKKLQEFQQNLIPYNRKYGYYFSTITSPSYQKEIRIFNLNDLLIYKANKYISNVVDKFEQVYKQIANTLSISKTIQTTIRFITYSYVAIRASSSIYGPQILIGEFALIISANESFINSFIDIFSSFIGMKIDIGHLKPFSEFMLLEDKQDNNKTEKIQKFESLEFKNVSFTYPNSEKLILDNISFKINKGEKISIVGLNNAGKTTIIKLICRFFEVNSGEILLNGKDILKYDKKSYYKMISAVFQDFSILPLSIGENIVGSLKINQNKLSETSKKVGIKKIIENLDLGYDTLLYKEIYDNSVDFSKGEKQKLAIARAIYKNSELVILDEPTSALDPLAEADVYEKFHSLTKNKTSIYISHRMSSSKFCDKILVLDKSKISGFASHKELMGKNKLYNKLYNAQKNHFKNLS